jgi:anti-sigma regulatory factor (Ser/Thr protein kinase)
VTAYRRLALAVGLLVLILLVVSALVAAAFAALPVAIAIASAVFALVVGLGSRGKVRSLRRTAGRFEDDPWAAASAPPPLDGLSWTTTWDALPPPSAMPAVRERAAVVLTEWDLRGEDAQPSLLALTELMTNAIEHACAPLQVTLGLGRDFVRVAVQDSAPEPPRARPREDGRGCGLELVKGVAVRHGWIPDPHGKVVWADVAIGWPE